MKNLSFEALNSIKFSVSQSKLYRSEELCLFLFSTLPQFQVYTLRWVSDQGTELVDVFESLSSTQSSVEWQLREIFYPYHVPLFTLPYSSEKWYLAPYLGTPYVSRGQAVSVNSPHSVLIMAPNYWIHSTGPSRSILAVITSNYIFFHLW